MNSLKTEFNYVYFTEWFRIQEEFKTPSEEMFQRERTEQMSSKVLSLGILFFVCVV